jgi:hypothetical protein
VLDDLQPNLAAQPRSSVGLGSCTAAGLGSRIPLVCEPARIGRGHPQAGRVPRPEPAPLRVCIRPGSPWSLPAARLAPSRLDCVVCVGGHAPRNETTAAVLS